MFKKIFLIIYSLYALLVLIFLILKSIPILVFISFLKLLNFKNTSRYNYYIIYYIFKIWYILIFIQHKEVYVDEKIDKNKQCIYVANHISYMDIPAIVLINNENLKILGKNDLSKIFIFGWIYNKIVVPVDRSNFTTRAKSIKILQDFIDSKKSIFIFPEGSFNESNQILKPFFNGAFSLAIENNLPIQPLLIIDSFERLHYKGLLNLTPGKSRVVFLPLFEITNYTKHDINNLKQAVFKIMEEGLKEWNS